MFNERLYHSMKPIHYLFLCPLIWMGCISAEVNIEHDPNDFDYMEIDVRQLREGYQNGEFTIAEITQAYLDRIEEVDFQRSRVALNHTSKS